MQAIRLVLLCLAVAMQLCATLGADTARAQTAAAEAPPATAPAAPAEDIGRLLDSLLEALEDPVARDELRRRLGEAAAQPVPPPPGAVATEDDLIKETLDLVGDNAARVSEILLSSARALGRLPDVYGWLSFQVGNPRSQALVLEVLRDLLLAIGAAGVPAALSHLGLRRIRARLVPGAETTAVGRVLLIVARLIAELVPVALFAAIIVAIAGIVELTPLARLIARQLMLAFLLIRLVAALRRAALYPLDGPGRIMPVSDAQAAALNRNIGRLTGISIIGYFALQIGLLFQLSWDLHEVLEHLLFFAVAAYAIILVLRSRQSVHDWLMELVERHEGQGLARALPLRGIARYWHIVAITWITVHFLAWALHLPGGLRWLLLNNLSTIVVLFLARTAVLAMRPSEPDPAAAAAVEGAAAEPARHDLADPGPAATAPGPVRSTLRVTVDLLTLGALVVIWTPGLTRWLTGDDGTVFVARLLQIAIVGGAIFLIWKLISGRVSDYLAAVDNEGKPQHGGRARTLAVIARNTALVLLLVFVVVFVLAEFGVNTGPLLAGAGVVGIAVGFGSQKLVQDIITGLFILLGDAIRVGDVVDLGGRSGVVEAISMRTVTLRGYNGDVHTVPYSTIDVVTNMTKDFSFAVFDVAVAYKEDVDRVMDALRDIDRQLRREWPFRRLMIEPIEIAGLDRFGDSAVVVKARIRTGPGDQWRVSREFNRRIKQRFDELGIEIPFPQRALVLGADKDGHAQTLALELRRRQPLPDAEAGGPSSEPLGKTG